MSLKKLILSGILPIFILGSITHFAYYLLFKNKLKLDFKRYFVAFTVSLLVSTFLMPFLYYTYRYGLGIHLLIVDILNLLCTVTMGQLLALHIYNHYSGKKIYFNLCVIVLILVVLSFVIFTFNPPHIPIFKDYDTGTYGIYHRR